MDEQYYDGEKLTVAGTRQFEQLCLEYQTAKKKAALAKQRQDEALGALCAFLDLPAGGRVNLTTEGYSCQASSSVLWGVDADAITERMRTPEGLAEILRNFNVSFKPKGKCDATVRDEFCFQNGFSKPTVKVVDFITPEEE